MNKLEDYKIHELAQKVPAPSVEDYAQLKKDIQRKGQEFPIIRSDGEIIDGKTRLKICTELGLEPHIEEYIGSLPVAQYILTTNIRRNLTKAQRHQLLADFVEVIIPQVRAEMRARKTGRPKKYVNRKPDEHIPQAANPGRKAIMAATGASSEEAINLVTIHNKAPELLKEVAQRGGLRYTAKEAHRRAENKPTQPKVTNSEPPISGRLTLSEIFKYECKINEPSIYPEDLPLPVHPTPGLNGHIQEAFIDLKAKEPLIAKMSRRQLYDEVWVYTQRIQTFAPGYGKPGYIIQDIDPRWIQWAKSVAGKVRAREFILLNKSQRPREESRLERPRKFSDAGFEKQLKQWQRLLKRGLGEILFAPDEQSRVLQATEQILSTHFEERRTRGVRLAPSQPEEPTANSAQANGSSDAQ